MNLDALFQAAMVHHRAGRLDEAIAAYRKILRRQPKSSDALHLLGLSLIARGEPTEGIRLLKRAIACRPDFPEAHYNLGVALQKKGDFEAAIRCYRRAVELDPGNAKAHNNLGNVLKRLARYDEAVACYESAVATKPDYAVAFNNLGIVYRVLSRLDEALQAFDRCLAIEPDLDDARFKRSEILLSRGSFTEGWRAYLERGGVKARATSYFREKLKRDLAGKRVRVDADQGLGDEIFFLRFAGFLKTRGAYVAYVPDPRLAEMLQRASIADKIIGPKQIEADEYDFRVSIGDLPYLLDMTDNVPVPSSVCLHPLPEKESSLRCRLAKFGRPPYIGVTWRAGTRNEEDLLFKEAPLDGIAHSLRGIPATFLALQRLPEDGEIDAFAAELGAPLHDLTELNSDLEAMLALMALIDGYVCVSNTNVHLRAATGRGCHVLVPHPPEFRWMCEGKVSPWFPESLVYRQDIGGHWGPALEEMSQDLRHQFGGE